jgi:hypothetical protein
MQMAKVGKVVVPVKGVAHAIGMMYAVCMRLCALVTMRSRRRIDGGPHYTIDESLLQNLRDNLRGGCARHAVETMEAPAHTEPTEEKCVPCA